MNGDRVKMAEMLPADPVQRGEVTPGPPAARTQRPGGSRDPTRAAGVDPISGPELLWRQWPGRRRRRFGRHTRSTAAVLQRPFPARTPAVGNEERKHWQQTELRRVVGSDLEVTRGGGIRDSCDCPRQPFQDAERAGDDTDRDTVQQSFPRTAAFALRPDQPNPARGRSDRYEWGVRDRDGAACEVGNRPPVDALPAFIDDPARPGLAAEGRCHERGKPEDRAAAPPSARHGTPYAASSAASSCGRKVKTSCSEAISRGFTPRRAAISRCLAGGMIWSCVQRT